MHRAPRPVHPARNFVAGTLISIKSCVLDVQAAVCLVTTNAGVPSSGNAAATAAAGLPSTANAATAGRGKSHGV